jgi:hypothetical protein
VQPAARGTEGMTSQIRGTAAEAAARASTGCQWVDGTMGHKPAGWKTWAVRAGGPEEATRTLIKTLTVMEVLISATATAKLMEAHEVMAQENLEAMVIRVLHP